MTYIEAGKPQAVDLPADIFAEAAAARRLLGAAHGPSPGAPAPGPAPVASPLVLPPGVELGSALVTETLGLLAGGKATLRALVRRAARGSPAFVALPREAQARQRGTVVRGAWLAVLGSL